jgi:hypothetical protein
MRHRVRQKWRQSEHIGASGQVVSWIRHGVRAKFNNGLRPKPINHITTMNDATQTQLNFVSTEFPRFEACGACERAYKKCYVFRIIFVSKPSVNKWQFIIDLRELNNNCSEFNMS